MDEENQERKGPKCFLNHDIRGFKKTSKSVQYWNHYLSDSISKMEVKEIGKEYKLVQNISPIRRIKIAAADQASHQGFPVFNYQLHCTAV